MSGGVDHDNDDDVFCAFNIPTFVYASPNIFCS